MLFCETAEQKKPKKPNMNPNNSNENGQQKQNNKKHQKNWKKVRKDQPKQTYFGYMHTFYHIHSLATKGLRLYCRTYNKERHTQWDGVPCFRASSLVHSGDFANMFFVFKDSRDGGTPCAWTTRRDTSRELRKRSQFWESQFSCDVIKHLGLIQVGSPLQENDFISARNYLVTCTIMPIANKTLRQWHNAKEPHGSSADFHFF